MSSTILRYSDQVITNVRAVLYNVKERGGLVPNSFLDAQVRELQGQYAADVLNIVLMLLGKSTRYQGVASEQQMTTLVEQARSRTGDLLSEIAAMRSAKGK